MQGRTARGKEEKASTKRQKEEGNTEGGREMMINVYHMFY